MYKLSQLAKTCCASLVFFSVSSLSSTIFEADKFFENKQYDYAKRAYSDSARLGSPHAFYQLGAIYLNGLGVTKDPVSAYIWLSMAAEYKFNDAVKASKDVFNAMSPAQQNQGQTLLSLLKKNLGKEAVTQEYFPILDNTLTSEKITFGGAGKLEVNYQDQDLMLDSFEPAFESNNFDSFDSTNEEDSFSIDSEDPFAEQEEAFANLAKPIQSRMPFLIVDYDVGPDGSVRNVRKVQEIGYARTILERFVFSTFPPPNFKENRLNFVNRSYIGSAAYSKFQMKDENELLFDRVRRHAKKLKKSNELEDQYQYAMMLLTFKWLKQEENEAEKRLRLVSEQGHPFAQYEYGAKLYREQTNIEEGIYWISQASKYGLAKAEYLLGTILLYSPWVKTDEAKALFWFESALKKDYPSAKLKAAELKLLASDTSLHDIPGATVYLTDIKESQRDNPEYYFLLAISHKNRENRDFRQVIRNVERAISLGEKYNWDVSYWQGLIEKWTTGSVYIND